MAVDLVVNDVGDDTDRGMMSVRILGNELSGGMYEIRGTLNGNYNGGGQEPGLRAEVSGNTGTDDSFDILFDNNRTVGDTRLRVQPFGAGSMEAVNPGSDVTFEGDVGAASF